MCGGEVDEAADCKWSVVPLWKEEIKQTIDILRIDPEKL